MVTLAVPLPLTPAAGRTVGGARGTRGGVGSTKVVASGTDTPEVGTGVSLATLCAPGTVLTGASFTELTVIAIVSVSVAVPSVVATVSVSAPLKLRLPV